MFRKLLLLCLLAAAQSIFQPAWSYSVDNGRIVDADGASVQLRGVSWFGFESNDHAVHGLWTRKWKDMITQMQGLGINAVRLPFCPSTLQAVTPGAIDYGLNPDLAGLNSLQFMDKVVQEFSDRGFYILLDHHTPDCATLTELWYTQSYSEQQWLDDLKFVAQRYAGVPGVIGLDLKNEPHGSATWGTGNPATDWKLAAEKAAAQVLALAPHWLMFVEGIGENPTCSNGPNHWWGGNIEPLACYPLTIPANRLVLAPHAYGPDVYVQSYFNDPSFPANMPAIWEQHFGQFVQQGYAVMLGEFGGKYGQGDPRDVAWQDAMVDYLIGKGINGGFYWSWNANSSDTGGILTNDWLTVREDKMVLLNRLWSGNGGSVPPPPPPPPPPGPVTLPAQRTITGEWGSGYCADVSVTNTTAAPALWNTTVDIGGTITSHWNATPSATHGIVSFSGAGWNDWINPGSSASFGYCATRDAAPPPPPPPPPTGEPQITTALIVDSDWGSGYCARVQVRNTGTATTDWAVAVSIDGSVGNLWNAIWIQAGQTLNAQGVSWNKTLSPGAMAEFGFCATR